MATTVYLSLGSNLGDREKNLQQALDRISALEGFELVAHSPVYITAAEDMKEVSPDFLNMVIKGDYLYRPLELLAALERIERDLGRTNKGEYLPRLIDIDILLFGREIIKEKSLAIPHPRLCKRTFVLAPLLQIEPELVHPSTRKKLSQYLDQKEAAKFTIYKEQLEINVGSQIYRH